MIPGFTETDLEQITKAFSFRISYLRKNHWDYQASACQELKDKIIGHLLGRNK